MNRFVLVALVLAAVCGQAVLAVDSQLVAQYPLSDELSDFVSNDVGPNGLNPVCDSATCPDFSAEGHYGSSTYVFNGFTDFLQASNSAVLALTGDLTLSAWINPSSTSIPYQMILVKGNGPGSPRNYSLYLNNDKVLVSWFANGAWRGFDTGSAVSIPANEWTHVAYVRNSGLNTESIFVNGTAVATQAIVHPLESNNYPLSIGGGQSASGEFFNGRLNDVRIYSRALSQAEVMNLSQGLWMTYLVDGVEIASSDVVDVNSAFSFAVLAQNDSNEMRSLKLTKTIPSDLLVAFSSMSYSTVLMGLENQYVFDPVVVNPLDSQAVLMGFSRDANSVQALFLIQADTLNLDANSSAHFEATVNMVEEPAIPEFEFALIPIAVVLGSFFLFSRRSN